MRRIPKKFAVMAVSATIAGVVGFTATPAPAAPIAYTTLSTDGCQLATIDLATGDVTALPAPPSSAACVDDLAVAPDGTVYGIIDLPDNGQSANLVTFDPTTGAVVDSTGFSGNFDASFTAHGGIAVDRNGVMYASFTTNEEGCSDFGNSEAVSCLYLIDPATAAATLIGPSGFNLVRMFWLTTNCDGAMLTGFSSNDLKSVTDASADSGAQAEVPDPIETFADDVGPLTTGLDLASVNEGTGAVTDGPPLDNDLFGLEWAPTGPLYAIGEIENNGAILHVFVVDPATGDMTVVADPNLGQLASIENLAMAVTCPTELVVNFTG